MSSLNPYDSLEICLIRIDPWRSVDHGTQTWCWLTAKPRSRKKPRAAPAFRPAICRPVPDRRLKEIMSRFMGQFQEKEGESATDG